jgi:hypothetical protein
MPLQAAMSLRGAPDLGAPCDPSRHKVAFGIMALMRSSA